MTLHFRAWKSCHLNFLITFSLFQNDSLLTGTVALSHTDIQRDCAEKTEIKGKRQASPPGCTQRPFEWAERRRNWNSGVGHGPWCRGRWTSPRDISVHRTQDTQPYVDAELTRAQMLLHKAQVIMHDKAEQIETLTAKSWRANNEPYPILSINATIHCLHKNLLYVTEKDNL